MLLTVDRVRAILSNYFDWNADNYVIVISAGCDKSDGYVSYIYKITIESPTVRNDLVIKCAPTEERFRQLMSVRTLYLAEMHFYERILPHFEVFRVGVNFPRYIVGERSYNAEAIILEDIRLGGYVMPSKLRGMDAHHLSYVLREYGRLHALSFILKSKNPDVYKRLHMELKRIHGEKYCKLNDEFYNWYQPSLKQTMKLFKEDDAISDRLRNLESSLEAFFHEIYAADHINSVFSHIDCWCNNMLFKYKDEQIESMYFLDFQYVWNTTPVVDVSYFFYVSAVPEEFAKLEQYLEIYYESLQSTTDTLGVDISETYPYSEFRKEWSLYAKYGYLRGLLGIPLSLREAADIVDVKDVVNEDMHSDKAFGVDEWSTQCVDWITTLTRHVCEYNLI